MKLDIRQYKSRLIHPILIECALIILGFLNFLFCIRKGGEDISITDFQLHAQKTPLSSVQIQNCRRI